MHILPRLATAVILSISVVQSTPSVWPTSSSGSNGLSAGSVSCVFRYSMSTGTNLPSKRAIQPSPTVNPDSKFDHDMDTGNDVSGSVADSTQDNPDEVDSLSGSSDVEQISLPRRDSEGNIVASTLRATSTKPPTETPSIPPTSDPPTESTADPADTPPSLMDRNTTTNATNTTTSSPSSGSDNGRRLLVAAEEPRGTTTTTDRTRNTTGEQTAGAAPVDATSGSVGDDAPVLLNPSRTAAPTSVSTAGPTIVPLPTSSLISTTPSSGQRGTNGSTATTDTAGSVDPSDMIHQPSDRQSDATFRCDATFYAAWSQLGLTCGGTALDVVSAAASAECLIYAGTSSGTAMHDLASCLTVCRFPACHDGEWDYTSPNGINSAIYANLDLMQLMAFAGPAAATSVVDLVPQPLVNLTFAATTECDDGADDSIAACQCPSALGTPRPSSETPTSTMAHYAVPTDKGLEDANHWADGQPKSHVDKVGLASATIGRSAATISVVAGSVMSVASGLVGGTSASLASGVSAAASVGLTMAAVDICQFSIMLTQLNVDARPRFMENMGKTMAPASFTFLPFGHVEESSAAGSTATARSRRLGSPSDAPVQGMEKYATLIGVDPSMLFYVAVAGIACMVATVFALYTLAMGVCYFVVEDFTSFCQTWLDKAIGVLVMILILSEYVVGATAMYQICYCIDRNALDASFGVAMLTLLCLAFGTILYGVLVIKNNEDELRDLGTKDHFDKKFHHRYGPLYDEHSFEGRFFFAPKLLLALLCGMSTGMIWIEGLWQIVVLIALHIVFLLYLEIKQPYPTAFVQKTSSFVIIIKISALFLSFFLLSSATRFTESIPDDLREGVAFAIVGLQVLVLLCLMIRQVYIFYRTWKLKRDGASHDDKTVTVQTTNAREGSEAFFALGGEPQYYGNLNQSRGGSLALLGDDATPKAHDSHHYSHETSSSHNNRLPLCGLQPKRTRTIVRQESHHRSNEVDL